MIPGIIRSISSKILRISAMTVLVSSILPFAVAMHWYETPSANYYFRTHFTTEGFVILCLLLVYTIYVIFTKKPHESGTTAAGYGAAWLFLVFPFAFLAHSSPLQGVADFLIEEQGIVTDEGVIAQILTTLAYALGVFARALHTFTTTGLTASGGNELLGLYFDKDSSLGHYPVMAETVLRFGITGSLPTLGFYFAHRLAGNKVPLATAEQMAAGKQAYASTMEPASVRFVDRK